MHTICNLATFFTLLRIALAPFVMLAVYDQAWMIAAGIFVCAAATDFLDGYYARLYQQESLFGTMLDPIADKILLFCTLFAVFQGTETDLVPAWFITGMVIKELLLVAGGCWLLAIKKRAVITPSIFSKVVTALLMVFIVFLIGIEQGLLSCYGIKYIFYFFIGSWVVIVADYGYQCLHIAYTKL